MARGKFSPKLSPATRLHDVPGDDDSKVVIDLDAADDDVQIVEVNDTPEADRGKDTEWHGESLADQEDDLRNYSANAQKRIKRLSAETHTQRRAREAAERERDEAIRYSQAQEAELQRLRLTTESGNNALLGSMRSEREGRITDATRRLEQAHAEGNSSAIAKATADLSQAQSELIAINTQAARAPAAPTPLRVQQQPAPQPRQQAPSIAPRALEWVQRNNWFRADGSDERSREALHINEELTRRGVDPNSDAYTRELDRRLKAVYPDHQAFDEERSTPRRSNPVAEGGRPNGGPAPSERRTVELSSTAVALAKQLGVPLKQYALSVQQYEAKRGAK